MVQVKISLSIKLCSWQWDDW